MNIFELVQNLSVLLALGLLYSFILRVRNISERLNQVAAGLIFGIVASVGILYSLQAGHGVIFDARTVILPMAGFFGGPVAAVLAGMLSIIARLIVGGEGLITGLVTILMATGTGILWRKLSVKHSLLKRPFGMLLTGLCLHILVAASMYLLPQEAGLLFLNQLLPVYLLFYPLAFTLLGTILQIQESAGVTFEKLQASEEIYHIISDASPEGIIILDGDNIISHNRSAEALLGYHPPELIKTYPELLNFDNTQAKAAGISSDIAPLEITLLHKNGQPVPIELKMLNYQYRRKPVRVLVMKDISVRKKEKEELLRSESMFKEAERMAHLGHWEYEVQQKKLFVSDELFAIYESNPVYDTNFVRFVFQHTHPDDLQNVFTAYRKALSEGDFQQVENRIITKSGRQKYIRQAFYSHLKDGKAIRSFGIIFDITDQKESFDEAMKARLNLEKLVDSRTQDLENSRKAAINLLLDANEQRLRAEGALRQLEDSHSEILKLSQAVEQSLAAVTITNFDGEVEYVNATFEEYSGYSKVEILGQKLDFFSPQDSTEELLSQIWGVLRNGESWKGEFYNLHKSGRPYWESVVISPIFNEKKEIVHFVKVSQDITSRKKLEKDLIEARDKADQATRAKSEFLANVSHEIRTPMNAILGFADLLSYTLTDNKSLDYLNSLKISGKNLLSLINDILDLSKVEAGMLKISRDYVSYRQLLKEIEQIFYFKTAEKGIRLNFEISPDFPKYIYTDETRLRQVLLNLVSNAVKYTDEGQVKVVTIVEMTSTNGFETDTPRVDMTIQVCDTGIGISEAFQKIIFQSFTQEEGHDRKKHGGTGLGLAITKKLVELLDGEISLTSQSGIGSTFTLQFRNVSTSNDQYAKPIHSSLNWQDIRFGTSKVMIVDDVDDNLKFLGQMLEYAGIQTYTSNSGEHAIEMTKRELPDLLITDIRMPDMDGFELFRKLRENDLTARIPIIASSASVLNDVSTEEWLSRFDGYLLKPIQTSELIDSLMRFLPYQLVGTTNAQPLPSSQKFNEEPVSISPEATQILHGSGMELWDQISERQPIKKVEEFANLLIDTGHKYHIEKLVSYGNELLQSRRSFNIEGMVRLIREFPDLVRHLAGNPSAD